MRRDLIAPRLALGLLLLAVAGSCAPSPKPRPTTPPPPAPAPVSVPTPAPTPSPEPQRVSSWDELPVIEGAWSYAPAPSRARFVDDSGLERLSLTCAAPGRTLVLALPGQNVAAADILTSSGQERILLANGAAEIAAAGIVLDRIAFSRGRFAVRGADLLVFPVQSEIGRVIEDCRAP